MQTTIETISQLERRVTFSLVAADVQKDVKKRLNRLSKTVKMAGFRPGHVPMKMIEQQYGAAAWNEVLTEKVQKRFNEVAEENKLRLAGAPQVSQKAATEENKEDLVFQADFEIFPEVKVADMAATELTCPQVEISEADVERTLETLRRQRAAFAAVDRAAAEGDRVVCDYVGTIDGVVFAGGEGTDLPVQIGAKSVLPEFEAAIVGAKAGDVKEFPLNFPADYHGEEVAGKTAQFKVTVKEVQAPELPAVDAAFAKSLGIDDGSIETLKAEVKKNLELQLKHRLENLVKEQVMKALRDGVETLLPKTMVAEEMQRLAGQMVENLKRQGMDPANLKFPPEVFREQAEKNIKLSLAIGQTVQQNQLAPQEAQVRALVSEMAQTYDDPETVVRWHFERPERLSRFTMLATERNIVEWAEKVAKVTSKPMSLEEVMNPNLTFVPREEEAGEEAKFAADDAAEEIAAKE